MANLTVSIPEDILRKARIRALEHRTSVNAVVRDYLERYAGVGSTAGTSSTSSRSARSARLRSASPAKAASTSPIFAACGFRERSSR